MNKKKIIAIGATATSLLLIAGIGVATWAITSTNGKVTTPGDNIDIGVVPPEYTDADWGTIAINNANDFRVAFDQNQILFTTGMTANSEWEGFYDLPETTTHITATWSLTKTDDTAPNLLDKSVEFYAYIYLENTTQVGPEKFTDYVDFVTSGSGDAWTNVSGASKQVISAKAITTGDKVIADYSCYEYQLAVGTSNNMGVTVPLNSGAPAWVSGKITLTFNLDNLLLYKDGKFDDLENDLSTFQTIATQVTNPVKVVIEARSKEEAAAKN